jgi:hypothetical protein
LKLKKLVDFVMIVLQKFACGTVNNIFSHSSNSPDSFGNEILSNNLLWQYVKSMSPETVAQLSKPTSKEVLQAIEQTIVSMLGGLPSESFNVLITTSRDNLGRLLASAMMNGYLLRNIEQRMELEKSLQLLETDSSD